MAIDAVGLTPPLSGYRLSTKNIFTASHRLKMGRIHTRAISAKVVQNKTFWQRTAIVLVGKTVSLHRPPSAL